jgi:hypothetical protein
VTALADPGEGFGGIDGERPLVCAACAPLFGPRPGKGDALLCGAPFTPDPLTGLEAPCGGHGQADSSGACVCFNSSAAGFWALRPLSAEANTLAYTAPFGDEEEEEELVSGREWPLVSARVSRVQKSRLKHITTRRTGSPSRAPDRWRTRRRS